MSIKKTGETNWNGEPALSKIESQVSRTETARRLKEVDEAMGSMITQKDLVRFLKNPENAQEFNRLVEDIRFALMDYKVCSPESLALIRFKICHRLRYDETSTTRTASRL